jgi:putative oxidoreductase
MKPFRKVDSLEEFEIYRPTATERQTAQQRFVEPAETLTRRQQIVCLVCSLVAAGIMLETLFFKFTAAPESVYIFRKMGTEPWMRWVQGVWELLASIGLLVPRWRWAGGILTTAAMAAAILSHMTWLGYSIQGDRGLLFSMALVTFTCGFTVMWTYRHRIPGYVPTTLY